MVGMLENGFVVSSIVEVLKSKMVDDWTAELAIIASYVLEK